MMNHKRNKRLQSPLLFTVVFFVVSILYNYKYTDIPGKGYSAGIGKRLSKFLIARPDILLLIVCFLLLSFINTIQSKNTEEILMVSFGVMAVLWLRSEIMVIKRITQGLKKLRIRNDELLNCRVFNRNLF